MNTHRVCFWTKNCCLYKHPHGYLESPVTDEVELKLPNSSLRSHCKHVYIFCWCAPHVSDRLVATEPFFVAEEGSDLCPFVPMREIIYKGEKLNIFYIVGDIWVHLEKIIHNTWGGFTKFPSLCMCVCGGGGGMGWPWRRVWKWNIFYNF
jgi:hypothetical protein